MGNSANRYSRQIKLPEVGSAGQEKLKQAKVLIVGIGGLGCPVAQYLVASGVGALGLLDHDRVDISNLHRQILYSEADLGKSKAAVAKEALSKLNSEVQITAFTESLTTENALDYFKKYDLIIDGTDNFQTKYLINDACVLTGKPWVYASIYKYEGQISVFNYLNGPTYRCLFPKVPSKDRSCEATGVIGVLPGVLGTLQATEALKILLGIGTVLSGKLKILDLLTMQDQLISFSRKEGQVNLVKEKGLGLEERTCHLDGEGLLYLDVREAFEQPKPIDKKVLQIPLNQLPDRYTEIPKDEQVYVYCQSGVRSRKAIQLLTQDFGFQNLINVEGGIQSLVK